MKWGLRGLTKVLRPKRFEVNYKLESTKQHFSDRQHPQIMTGPAKEGG
jgi:hypothetical protein